MNELIKFYIWNKTMNSISIFTTLRCDLGSNV